MLCPAHATIFSSASAERMATNARIQPWRTSIASTTSRSSAAMSLAFARPPRRQRRRRQQRAGFTTFCMQARSHISDPPLPHHRSSLLDPGAAPTRRPVDHAGEAQLQARPPRFPRSRGQLIICTRLNSTLRSAKRKMPSVCWSPARRTKTAVRRQQLQLRLRSTQ